MLTRKSPPSVGDAATDRVIRQIYDDINAIIDQLNKASTVSDAEGGKSGDIRIERVGSTNTYSIRFRSQDGWVEIDPDVLTFKDKTS